MARLHQDILRELGILQQELQNLGIWSDIAPSEEALLSTEAFKDLDDAVKGLLGSIRRMDGLLTV